ncbi:PilW family protein [Georgfuchsia toluolica]|nr:PilW family protein [Georgfuchsia toluolica]
MQPSVAGLAPSSRLSQAGMSLVEVLIAMTIGLILMTGISILIVRQNAARVELAKSSRQIENGRYAMQLLHDDIQLAGFWGEYSPPFRITTPPNATTYVVDGSASPPLGTCASPSATAPTNLGWAAASMPTLPVAILGYAGATTNASLAASAPCIPTADRKPDTAVLVVRRVATSTVAAATAVTGTAYLQVSQCATDSAETPFVMAVKPAGSDPFTLTKKDCATKADLRPYVVRIYFVSNCNNYASGQTTCTATADNGKPIPTLKMVEFINGTQSVVPLVEGIEDMQVDYGIGQIVNAGPTYTHTTAPVSYTNTPSVTQWEDVVAVRLNILARNTESTTGYADTKAYTLGGAGVINPCANDPFTGAANTAAQIASCQSYPRHVYSELTRVENVSARREQP